MATKLTKQDLIDFEEDIAAEFNAGKIKAPVHLNHGNEDELISIFESIGSDDWVLSTWRSHYHCLLKGVPKELLKKEILSGKSISLSFPEYKIFSSAIVTGILPIAVGIGLSIKKLGKRGIVTAFVGDMTAETGAFEECVKYSDNHNLPIIFVVEDNNKSVCTDTRKTWNSERRSYGHFLAKGRALHYGYESKWPHAGAGKRIQF